MWSGVVALSPQFCGQVICFGREFRYVVDWVDLDLDLDWDWDWSGDDVQYCI